MAPDKTGKTSAALSVALAHAKSDAPGKIIWLDTDNKADILLYRYPELRDKVEIHTIFDWLGLRAATTEVNDLRKRVTKDDWLIGDVYGYAWHFVQEFVTEAMYQMPVEDYDEMVDRKRAQAAEIKMTTPEAKRTAEQNEVVKFANDHGFGGRTGDYWQEVARRHRGWEMKFIMSLPCHILLTTHEKTIIERAAKAGQTVKDFGDEFGSRFDEWGVRPDGSKATVSRVKTVGQLRRLRTGGVILNTIDNGGDDVKGLDVSDTFAGGGGFAEDFLVNVRGWSK